METFPSAGEGEAQETYEAGELHVFGKADTSLPRALPKSIVAVISY